MTLRRQIPTTNRIRQLTLVTAVLVVARQHRLVIIAAIRRPAVGEMTVGHHPHHVTLVGTRLLTAGVMTAGHHRRHHLAIAGMTIDAMMIDVAAMVEIVVSPLHGIVDAATRVRGVLVLVDVMNVSVLRRHVERAVESRTGTGTVIGTAHVLVPVIMSAEEMIRGRDTGTADADISGPCYGSYTLYVHLVSSV